MNSEDLEILYRNYSTLVFNLALQYVQNVEDAEEITQDVFVTVHQKWATFRQDAAPSTWIYRIAINKSLDFLKAKKRKKRLGFLTTFWGDSPNELQAIEFNHPGVLLEQQEEMAALFALINELPDAQKTVLILLKIEGKTQQEAAAIMDCSVKAVESLWQRAKKNLEKKINLSKENEK
jgi:RNA polymerase sigma factor (sigma-70 family)